MIRYRMVLAALSAAALMVSAACTHAPSAPSSASASGTPGFIAAAIASSNRPDADKQLDANRKPVETLEFAEVKPGEKIGELLPGNGYFTRLFSLVVGPTGHVYAMVPARPANAPAGMPDFAAKPNAIAADPNFSNVSVVQLGLSKLTTPQPIDLYFTAQNYHDLHNFPGLDIAAFNKAVFDSLKPGGLYIVLDHSAQAGSGVRDTNTLHRIDPESVKAEVAAAGFVFVASTTILANPADSRTTKVFDPTIRGKTDQFILKFRKPKT
jgi:predicted methyltransferase